VCSLVEADALVILTDVAGLYDGDPNAGAKLISDVQDIDREARPVAGGSTSGVGTGGMASKVEAARVAGRFGVPTLVTSGRRERPVTSLLDGAAEGTVFWPSLTRLQSRKHWIAYALKPQGVVVVDSGARRALTDGKKSLLASGVRGVRGRFGAGDSVSVADEGDVEFARGLVAFDAEELEKIAGRKSADIESLLGYRAPFEVIHRDDLVLL
jgi:glutamate 5-kinase